MSTNTHTKQIIWENHQFWMSTHYCLIAGLKTKKFKETQHAESEGGQQGHREAHSSSRFNRFVNSFNSRSCVEAIVQQQFTHPPTHTHSLHFPLLPPQINSPNMSNGDSPPPRYSHFHPAMLAPLCGCKEVLWLLQ